MTLSFVYTNPKLKPARIKLNAISKGVFIPKIIMILPMIRKVNAPIYNAFLENFASNLARLKFKIIHATDNGKITNPL